MPIVAKEHTMEPTRRRTQSSHRAASHVTLVSRCACGRQKNPTLDRCIGCDPYAGY